MDEVVIPDGKPRDDVMRSDPCLGLKTGKLLGCGMDGLGSVSWRLDQTIGSAAMGPLSIYRGDPAASPSLFGAGRGVVGLTRNVADDRRPPGRFQRRVDEPSPGLPFVHVEDDLYQDSSFRVNDTGRLRRLKTLADGNERRVVLPHAGTDNGVQRESHEKALPLFWIRG